jgi:uncharacterized protein (DUF1800 family)
MIARLGRRGFVGGAAVVSAALWLPRTSQAAQAMGFDDARHLLSRTSFGATPAEIEALASLDYAVAVDRLISRTHPQALTAGPPWVNEGPSFLRQQAAAQASKNTGDTKPVQLVQQQVREHGRELRVWWVEEMLATDQPLVERMTLFWHNHFTSSAQKVRHMPSLYWQNVLFRREALGNFAVLLKAVARDPAMLIYLDGVRSVARQPNENFARELLELFTLGEGHYTEADIKNAARAFTGWSIDRETGHFVDHHQQHDDGEKTFLGQTGRFNGDDIIAIVLRQPRTAETIVEKLWREFVSLTPQPDEVKRLAAIFRNGGYEMKPLMRAMLLSPVFREPTNRGALIKSPIELIVGTVHILGLPVPEKTGLVRMMAGLGQSPFDPPNVKGWPGGESWITTNTLLLRQQFLRRMVEATTVSPMEAGNMMPGQPNRRADRREQMAPGNDGGQVMEQRPIEGRSLRNAGTEVRIGPTLAGFDASTLVRTLLPRGAIDGASRGDDPGAVVASAMLDTAYQLK